MQGSSIVFYLIERTFCVMFARLPRPSRLRNAAASEGARGTRPGAVSRQTWLRLVLLFGPLVLLVALMRLLEYTYLTRAGAQAPGLLVASSAALTPFVLLLASLGFYGWLRMRWPRLRPVGHFVLVSLATALLMVAAWALMPPWTSEWLSSGAFEAIRWDVLLLLLVALSFLFLLERTRGWPRLLSLAVLYVLVSVLMLLPAVALGYRLSTGTPMEGTLLKYFLFHISDLAGVVSGEVRGLNALLLLLPLLILLLPTLLLRLPPVRRWATPPAAEAPAGTPWHVLWGALPVLLLLTLPPRVALPNAFEASSYTGMVGGMVQDASAEAAYVEDVPPDSTPPFDTRALRFAATDSTRRMNVVLVIMESTRAASTTPYQPDLDTTPFLDSLARHGLLVEQMYAVVPYTNKALTPLLAGIYPYPHRDVVESRPGGVPGPGLAGLLRPLGYRSAFFTPADLGYEDKDLILRNFGFDTVRGDGAYPKDGFERTNYFGYEDRIILQPSLDWVDERRAAGEPFFLAYLTLVAHHPYAVPSTFPQRDYGVEDPSLNHYLNALRYTDAFLREIVHAFAARNLLDETLFIILGDHGQAFGEHGQRMHTDVLWDEALHVPTVLYNPVRFPKSGRIAGPRQQIDLLPTVADVLNLRVEGGFYPGSSLLHPPTPGRALFHSAWESNVALAMRRDSLKVVLRFQQPPMDVFDFRNDPLERHNLADDLPPERLQAAQQELLLWRQSVQQIYEDHLRHMAQ